MSDEIQEGLQVPITPTQADYPDWYLKNYEFFEKFLALSIDERSDLIGRASAAFMTIMASLTPEGHVVVAQSGKQFFDTNREEYMEKMSNMPQEMFVFLLIGVLVESMGLQEFKLESAAQ